MTAVGWIGVWLLIAALALIFLELALIGSRMLRLQGKAMTLRSLLEREDGARSEELLRLRLAMSQIDLRLRPYRRTQRLVLHPLTLALLESYRRRRSER